MKNVENVPTAPPARIPIGVPYVTQKALNVSLTLSGGITCIVKFAGPVMWPIVGYFLDTLNSGSTDPFTVSLNIGDVGDVVCISNEALKGMVYTPNGDCGETSTLNNGG